DIRENEEKLRLFIEHAPASLAMFDKRMCYQAVSNRWINDYHLEGREILGHSHYEIFPEISEEWKAIHRRALAGEVISADEDAFHRLDGSTQWLKWEVRPWYRSDQSIGGIVVFSEDISLAKEVTDELRQSEERFSKIFSSSPVGTSLIRAADQVFVAINQAALQISGFTREEVLGKTSLDLGINATLEQRQENYRHINQSGMIHNADATLRRKDGSLRRVLLSAQFLEIKGQKFILSQMIDDTERKQALEALSRERENFFKLFYNSPAAMVVSRRSDGQIKTVNDTYTRLIGYSAGELVGHTPIDYPLYVNPDERSFILQLLKEKGQIQNYELLIRSRSGEIITVVLSMEPLVYNEEDCLLSALINISDRKLAEQEVQRLNSDLERRVTERTTQLAAANKELEAFAYSVSHDLRAPLRRINGWSQILFEDDYEKLDEQGREYLKTIRSETRRMSALIDDMLRLSQISRIEMAYTRVDMSALARSISDRLINEQTERQVNFVIQPGLTVMGDEKLLEIMLTNLLSNAFKFTSRNSAARIEFGRMQKDDHPTWFVRDNGVGFDMAHAKNLFGPFQRLHSQAEFPGTGVGLATVQRVINRHGGLIWAEAETNVGAVFYFTLNAG
ncbi:MAG: PAS domain S-box protein, partial [Anaerolineae bacterium]|nr:PAS domain S-box protein [Anaerolineae bacterium]